MAFLLQWSSVFLVSGSIIGLWIMLICGVSGRLNFQSKTTCMWQLVKIPLYKSWPKAKCDIDYFSFEAYLCHKSILSALTSILSISLFGLCDIFIKCYTIFEMWLTCLIKLYQLFSYCLSLYFACYYFLIILYSMFASLLF